VQADHLISAMSAYSKVLYHALPALLRGCGCAGAANDLVRVLRAADTEIGELVDALDECCASANEAAAHQHLELAAAAHNDRVAALARHLAQHETMQLGSPGSETKHLARALDIAAELGHPAGPAGVVH